MEAEYQALLRNNTWELVPPSDANHVIQSMVQIRGISHRLGRSRDVSIAYRPIRKIR